MNNGNRPRPEALTELLLLEEIERNPEATQREFSRSVGISLGLTNLLIRKMARKALIKISSVPGRRLLYALTPQGFSEKIRKTRDFVQLSFRYYGDMKKEIVRHIQKGDVRRPRVAQFGAEELSELVAEAAREARGRYIGELNGEKRKAAPDVLILFARPKRAQRSIWAKKGIRLIDLS